MRTNTGGLVRHAPRKSVAAGQIEGLAACPACGSGRVACCVGTGFDVCISCRKLWERLPAAEPYTVDGEQLPFAVPCDNCAFRGDSPERKDQERWLMLQESFAEGGEFFCHKAVPFALEKIRDGRVYEFEFPQVEKTVDIAGACHPYKSFDTNRMRLCRGFLNQWVVGLT